MKDTARLKEQTRKKTVTEAVTVTLTEWLPIPRVRKLNDQVRELPLSFNADYSAEKVRDQNRDL